MIPPPALNALVPPVAALEDLMEVEAAEEDLEDSGFESGDAESDDNIDSMSSGSQAHDSQDSDDVPDDSSSSWGLESELEDSELLADADAIDQEHYTELHTAVGGYHRQRV